MLNNFIIKIIEIIVIKKDIRISRKTQDFKINIKIRYIKKRLIK